MNIFYCKHCDVKFTKEFVFKKHACEAKKRYEIMQTPMGKSSFYYYKKWMLLKNKNRVTELSTFTESKYFSSFMNFMNFANATNLPDKEGYIKYMISNNLLPGFWCKNDIYVSYIQNYDKIRTPIEQVMKSIDTLYKLSTSLECKITDIFENMLPGDILKLIQSRNLSPWLLLFSLKFKDFLETKTSFEQRILLQTIINPRLWKEKFENSPEEVEKIKNFVKELKL